MISGDNLETAKAIAVDAGILDAKSIDPTLGEDTHNLYAMTAREFREIVGGLAQTEDSDGNKIWVPADQNMFD